MDERKWSVKARFYDALHLRQKVRKDKGGIDNLRRRKKQNVTMIKIFTNIAEDKHGYTKEQRRQLLYAIATDVAYMGTESTVQWSMKVRNDYLVMTINFFRSGVTDWNAEDVFFRQFLKRGIESELITVDRCKEGGKQ